MGILIKGLAKLKKIPETVKAIKERLEHELKQIVKRSTTQVADNGYQRGENVTQDNQPRYENMWIHSFKFMVCAHEHYSHLSFRHLFF